MVRVYIMNDVIGILNNIMKMSYPLYTVLYCHTCISGTIIYTIHTSALLFPISEGYTHDVKCWFWPAKCDVC